MSLLKREGKGGGDVKAAIIFSAIGLIGLALEYSSLSTFANSGGSAYVATSIGNGYWVCCAGAAIVLFGSVSRFRSKEAAYADTLVRLSIPDELAQLAKLHADGVLSDVEYAVQKDRLLRGS